MRLTDSEKNLQIRDFFFAQLVQLAHKDKDIVLLTADIGCWGINNFKEWYPDRFFNVGVAEQNMINIATGMALLGKKPFVVTITSFLLRCLEQIRVNICGMKLPIVIVGMGTGNDYWYDGMTHNLPNANLILGAIGLHVFTPTNHEETVYTCELAYKQKTPTYIGLKK